LARLADRHTTDITDGRFVDTDPAFTADGRYLAFLSKRSFDPVYDAHTFDLSFPYGSRPFLLTLTASTPSPFGPLVGGRPVGSAKHDDQDKDGQDKGGEDANGNDANGNDTNGKDADGKDADGKDANGRESSKAKKKPVVIDLEGLSTRIVQVPVQESRYTSLRAVEGGLVWLKQPLTGNLGEGGAQPDDDQPRLALGHFDIKRTKTTQLGAGGNGFEASTDGARRVCWGAS